MIYGIRCNRFVGTGSNSLEMYFADKEAARERVERLNAYLSVYYVETFKLEDEDDMFPESFDKVYEIRASNFGKIGTSPLSRPQFFKSKENVQEAVARLNNYMHVYSYIEIPLEGSMVI